MFKVVPILNYINFRCWSNSFSYHFILSDCSHHIQVSFLGQLILVPYGLLGVSFNMQIRHHRRMVLHELCKWAKQNFFFSNAVEDAVFELIFVTRNYFCHQHLATILLRLLCLWCFLCKSCSMYNGT